MKLFRRHSAKVNAGSMADIAFLLLIFFLVTTTISADKGILRQLPSKCPPNINCDKDSKERNVLRIAINADQEIMIEDDIVKIDKIKDLVKAFVDNDGNNTCNYCKGDHFSESSDHPKNAIISLSYDALTKYELFITVQDEISKSYYELRKRYAEQVFNKSLGELTHNELNTVREAYPFIISEVMH